MVWMRGVGVALVALAGCSSFVQGDTDGGSGDGATSSAGSTAENSTANPSTSGASDSAGSGGPDSAPMTSNSTTSATSQGDPSTNPSASDADSDPTGSDVSSGETETSAAASSSGADTDTQGSDTDSDSDGETTGDAECIESDVEPNDDIFNDDVQDVGAQPCDATAATFNGTMFDADDTDWFIYEGTWNCGNFANPNHTVEVTSGNVSVCVFPVCADVDDDTDTTCLAGTTVFEKGSVGCCSDTLAIADVNCAPLQPDETAFGFVRIRTDAQDECADYSVEYSVLAD